MRVVTFTNDESQSPHISKSDTTSQSFILNQGFLPVGVFFSVVAENIADTYKWSKQVVGDLSTFDRCRFDLSDNKKCDKACDSEEFGYDHGQCLCPDQATCGTATTTACRCLKGDTPLELATPAYCNGAAATNGRCDVVCNLVAFEWDHGECCTAKSRFCYDPQYPIDSMQSSFVSIAEAVTFVKPRESELTSLIMPFTLSDQTLGLAALPQRPPRTVPHGLFLANSARQAWGQHLDGSGKKRYGVTAFHEIMHIFGLLHTHQNYDQAAGQVKKDICEMACVEIAPSMIAGDFCDDTPPTPENRLCQDPEPCSQTTKGQWCSDCQSRVWRGTNFANVMGYAPDECIYNAAVSAFAMRGNNSRSTGYQVRILESGIKNGYLTPLQAARARCFYDARWTNLWALQKAPSVVPVPPKVSVGAGGLVGLTIEWLFPVYLGNGSTISFTIERDPAFEVSGGAVNLPHFAISGLPSEQTELPKVPLGVDYFYTGFKIGDIPLNFGHYRDKTAAAAVSYRYRVRAGGAGDVSLSWSDWSEMGRADGGSGCPGNCNGHGQCNNGVCQCNAGWSKRDPLCRVEDECAGGEGTGCLVSEVGDGKCQEKCLDCSDAERERTDCEEQAAGDCKCPIDRWGDGRCDQSCNTEVCQFDLGDCAGCSAACPLSWKGDGVCDPECNTAGACDFDGGDCETVSCNQKTDRTVLPCKRSFIGDGRCDLVCNVTACDFDKGDCGAQCSPGCRPEMVGNGFCDDACRAIGNDGKPLCTTAAKPTLFDGGDCLSCAPGCVDSWVGDGSCDEACRIADACKNDLLDCTGCPCNSELLGNGKCDGPCNIEGCQYDKGDCPKPIRDRVIETLSELEPWQIGLIAGVTICLVCVVVIIAVVCLYRKLKRRNLAHFDVVAPTEMDAMPEFKCPVCGKAYEVEGDIAIHMRARHSDQTVRDSSAVETRGSSALLGAEAPRSSHVSNTGVALPPPPAAANATVGGPSRSSNVGLDGDQPWMSFSNK